MTDPAFWDRAAPKYALRPISDPASYEYTLGRTRAHLGKSDKVLEMGCGTGSTALWLAEHVGHMTATDISPGMIAIAQDKSIELTNLTFAVHDATPMAGEFDAILAFNLFHLVPDMEDRFRQIHAALPEGGMFISKTPCLRGGIKGVMIGLAVTVMRALGKAPYLRRFTGETLEEAITDTGFEIVECGDHPAPSRYVVARKCAA